MCNLCSAVELKKFWIPPPQCSWCLARFDTVVDVHERKIKISGPPSNVWFSTRKVAFILLIVCLSSIQIDRTRGPKSGTHGTERNVLNLVRKLTHREQSFVVEAPICVHLNTEPYLLVVNEASKTLVCCCEVEHILAGAQGEGHLQAASPANDSCCFSKRQIQSE